VASTQYNIHQRDGENNEDVDKEGRKKRRGGGRKLEMDKPEKLHTRRRL